MQESSDCRYIVRTKYNEKFQFVFLNESELTVQKYVEKVRHIFNIDKNITINVNLFDNLRTPISAGNFPKVIANYSNSGSFYINFSYDVSQLNIEMVTSESLADYLSEMNADDLLSISQNKGTLNETKRRNLATHVGRFIITKFGKYPSHHVKKMTAKAVIALFPCQWFKESVNDGIDLWFNSKNGYIDNKLKYIRRKQKENTPQGLAPVNDSMENNSMLNKTLDASLINLADHVFENNNEIDFEREVVILKSAMVTDQNIPMIKEKLIATMAYRLDMLKTPEIDLLENFPYFFTNPELILFDFRKRFLECNSNIFCETWSTTGERLQNVLMRDYPTSAFVSNWSKEVEQLLILLKLLPSKNTRHNNVEVFKKAIKKIIIFRELNATPAAMIEKQNNFPYIIACGNSKNNIVRYYIDFEKNLIDVPETFGFIQTFDLLFKVHKNFNLNFDPSVAPMMSFIQLFIYRLPQIGIHSTNRMKEISNKLQ